MASSATQNRLWAGNWFAQSRVASVGSQPQESSQAEQVSLKGKRAVVVEDQGVTQLQLRKILRSEGLEVVGVASNGREAVDLVFASKPDVVLMDIRMPVMDGLEATRLILQKLRVCVIMLTAYSEKEHQDQAQQAGACGYVLKPVTTETLVPQIRAALDVFNHRQ